MLGRHRDDQSECQRWRRAHAFTPEAIYERRWALALLERAVDDVQKRYAGRGNTELFEALKEYLGHDPGGVPYRELSQRLNQTETALRTALSRLRSRWRARLRELVAETVQEGHMVDDELHDLIRALAPPV